jgi:hypothetical protein
MGWACAHSRIQYVLKHIHILINTRTGTITCTCTLNHIVLVLTDTHIQYTKESNKTMTFGEKNWN